MCNNRLKWTIMKRDGISSAEADELMGLAREDFYDRLEYPYDYDGADDICADWFSLEPDYILDLV